MDSNEQAPGIAGYAAHAEQHAAGWEAVTFEAVHAAVLDLLPSSPVAVLDVGAGSGRDAAALARLGYPVTAVEPVEALLALAHRHHPDPAIHWVADALPHLARVPRPARGFGLIWLSAVWMHLPPPLRAPAFARLVELAAPCGRLMFSLRLAPFEDGRTFHEARAQSLVTLAHQHGLTPLRCLSNDDAQGREALRWETLMLEKTN